VALGETLLELQQLTERLRRDCPWDREQTARTIVPHTIEEAYEVADAALADDRAKEIARFRIEESSGHHAERMSVRTREAVESELRMFQRTGVPSSHALEDCCPALRSLELQSGAIAVGTVRRESNGSRCNDRYRDGAHRFQS